jgi:ATP-dependent 26S proteasome regulatory subunit
MEEYDGITILATNLRQNIDDAFIRRIRFIINFPFPKQEYRLNIWKGIWPESLPLDTNIDLEFMAAQFELSGGNIRNIALTAAFNAANNGKAVNMKHLIHATKREFQKMGKICVSSDFGNYRDLV